MTQFHREEGFVNKVCPVDRFLLFLTQDPDDEKYQVTQGKKVRIVKDVFPTNASDFSE